MKNKKERIIMTDDLQMKYDALCYAIMQNVTIKSHGADRICFVNFDPKNDEHLCILAVTSACAGILGDREVTLDCDAWSRRKLAKKYKKMMTISKAEKDEENVVDVVEMLEFMRPHSKQLCGEDFTFGDIYREFYCEGK
jgi:hypothetical protein